MATIAEQIASSDTLTLLAVRRLLLTEAWNVELFSDIDELVMNRIGEYDLPKLKIVTADYMRIDQTVGCTDMHCPCCAMQPILSDGGGDEYTCLVCAWHGTICGHDR